MRLPLTILVVVLASAALRGQGNLTGVTPGGSAGVNDSSKVAAAELRRSALEFRDAYNRNDLSTLAGFYAEDAWYVSPHVPDLMIRGRDRIRANWERGIAMGGHIDTVEVLTIDVMGDMGYLVSVYKATNDGRQVSGRNVIVMKRINGKWLIVSHASVIRD